ncbi:MAG: IclR family transcriptional regulator [Alphaproteobacteria bacterium]|nr:IclR family transcriptional regulator [Alphaproteobacteria bacterium]
MSATTSPKENSVIKAFEILNVISSDDRGFLPSEVADGIGMNLSTTHRFLLTLEEIGAVTRSAGNRYHLGLMVAELGRNVTRKDVLADAARPVINQLANKYRETVSMATFDGHQLDFVAWAEPRRPLSMNLRRDQPLPLHCSSIGKVIMAGLPAIEREELLSKLSFEKFTDKTITDIIALRKEV